MYLLRVYIFFQVATKGYAQYNLFCSLKEESMMSESQSSVIASLTWNNVEKVLECPPLSSKASLVSISAFLWSVAFDTLVPISPMFWFSFSHPLPLFTEHQSRSWRHKESIVSDL